MQLFVGKIGDSCDVDVDCSDSVSNSFCDNNECDCKSGYMVTDPYKCTRRK